jgi:hypothetical protein
MKDLIPILSLIVAALAVFVGPIISYLVAKRQIASALATSHKQITAPMRQAWINSLRDLLAEITSSALHYYCAGFEERNDSEYRHLTLLEHRIQLMLNPKEDDHTDLEQLIRKMVSSLQRGKVGDEDFCTAHTKVMALSRQILKREWNVVKKKIKTTELTSDGAEG